MTAPTFDLPSALAAMADYPEVLRRFGVIRVLEIDLAGSGIAPGAGPVSVTATPAWTPQIDAPGQCTVVPVEVPAVLGASRFGLTADGRVDPAAAQLGVLELDTDSAAIRHVDLARQVVNAERANADAVDEGRLPPVDPPEQLSLPSLRNAGLSLYQGDRAVDLHDKLVAAASLLTATDPIALTDAAQAARGFVVDVWDERMRTWRTLCARRGTYKLPGVAPFTRDDLGAVSLAVTSRPEATALSPLYLHQSLVRWTGWSLVAPPPGQVVVTEAEGRRPDAPAGPALPGLEVSFTPVPGTLPTLRFGRGYRFQLRTVDLVGGVAPLAATSTDLSRAFPPATEPPARHLRFEPVIAPIVVATAPMSEGESLETLVLRPEPGLAGVVSKLLAPLLGTPPVRHIVPPKVSEGLCEEHGVLDTAAGKPDPGKYKMLAERDRADLAKVGKPDPRMAPGSDPAFPAQQRYVPGTVLPVTWLADPISRGGAISGLPGGLLRIEFGGAWPDVRGFRIQLVDGTSKPAWNGVAKLLTVYVPRGETLAVRLSSFVNDRDVDLLGQFAWLAESADSATIQAVRKDIVAGQAWQVTPFRPMRFVNAVRVPVRALSPFALDPSDPAAPRGLGATRQELVGSVSVHRPSTGQLSLVADWTDPVDDLGAPRPSEVRRTARPPLAADGPLVPVLDVAPGPDPVTGEAVPFTSTHTFNDTKRHRVTYSVVGTTRYLEHFVQRGLVKLDGTAPVKLSSAGIVPGTDTVRAADGSTSFRRGVDYDVDLTAGTVARRSGGAIPAGAQVEVAIVAPPVTRTSKGVLVDVPSSARPAPPQIAWVVPTFGWAETTANKGLQKTRTRSGGGLRIFLDRPWYSSGTGEQLAVVLADRVIPDGDAQARSLVTQLGADPIAVTNRPGGYPLPEQFPLARERRRGLVLPELEDRGTAGSVAIAAHDVVWDEERQRWACDVVLPPGVVYQPFVRLALARYQPHSVDDVHLSAVADVEWAQLNPDRVAAVALDAKDLTKVTVTVTGQSPAGTQGAPSAPNAVTVLVQTAPAAGADELQWTTVGPGEGQALTPAALVDGRTSWTGVVRLAASRRAKPTRLVITEREQHVGGGRLVYSDVIPL